MHVTKRVTIEKSKLYFIIPKTILVIPHPNNFLVNYPLSLKLVCQLFLILKTGASALFDFDLLVPGICDCFTETRN